MLYFAKLVKKNEITKQKLIIYTSERNITQTCHLSTSGCCYCHGRDITLSSQRHKTVIGDGCVLSRALTVAYITFVEA